MSNVDNFVNVNDLIDSIVITFICPICKIKKDLRFPKSVVDQAKTLTTISIPKGLICEHHFQAFIDKNYKIRGYQKVDFEFDHSSKKKPKRHRKSRYRKSDKELFENLITEGNYVKYYPDRLKVKKKITSAIDNHSNDSLKTSDRPPDPVPDHSPQNQKSPFAKFKERSLEEIYEDFWEFIDDDNEQFIDLIINDPRRNFDI